ncbi:MAG: transglycosylase SLT domain-containing protein, partial [Pseudomonadota bacterium]
MTTAIIPSNENQTPVHKAIRAASRATGIGFDYLMNTATRESNLNPSARAKSSSASGLFQFVDSTWLQTMQQHGAELGYAQEAEAIRPAGNGNYTVDDPAMRQRIMALRFDPKANAMMAGAFTQQNNQFLSTALDRAPTQGELYIAHFLGAEGAEKFISKAQDAPTVSAAALFPKAASANPSIFYAQGRSRSMGEVYTSL